MDTYYTVHKWIIEILVCSWNLFLVISLCTKLQSKKHSSRNVQPQTPRLILWSATMAFLGFPICYTIKLVIYMMDLEPTPTIEIINLSVVWFSFAVSRLSFYCFMLSRLYYSFAASAVYRVPKITLYIHIAVLSICPIYLAFLIVLKSKSETEHHYYIGTMIGIVMLSFGALHILLTFNRQLTLVIMDTQMNLNSCGSQSGSTRLTMSQSVELTSNNPSNRMTRRMFQTMVRQNILCGIINISFTFLVILYGIFEFCEFNKALWTALSYLMVITINIATFCIYLSFGINTKTYNTFCARIQVRCETLCGRIQQRTIELKTMDSVMTDQDTTADSVEVCSPPSSTI